MEELNLRLKICNQSVDHLHHNLYQTINACKANSRCHKSSQENKVILSASQPRRLLEAAEQPEVAAKAKKILFLFLGVSTNLFRKYFLYNINHQGKNKKGIKANQRSVRALG